MKTRKWLPKDFMVSVANRVELVDYDYTDKLSPEEYVWLMRFNAEHVNASFDYDSGSLFNNNQVKASYSENYRRNNDLFSIKRNTGKLQSLTNFKKNTNAHGRIFWDSFEKELIGEIVDEELYHVRKQLLLLDVPYKMRKVKDET